VSRTICGKTTPYSWFSTQRGARRRSSSDCLEGLQILDIAALIHDGKALQLDRVEAIMEENAEYDKRQQKMA
jgi:hypothetical protein